MAKITKKKSKRIAPEARSLTAPIIDQELGAACLKAFQLELSDGLDNRWTPDASGEIQSSSVPMESLKAFLRHHPRTARGQVVGLTHCDADAARHVLKRMAAKREGRVGGFDPMVVRTLIRLNQTAGRSTTDLKRLLLITKKKVRKKDRSFIKHNADEYRKALLAYFANTVLPKTPSRALVFARDRALITMLLHFPLRRTTLFLAQRNWLKNGVLTIPSDGIKTREEVSIPLPKVVAAAVNAYLELRTDSCEKLFATSDGQELEKASIYKALARRSGSILKVSIGLHNFRRLVASSVSKQIGSEATSHLLIISQKTLMECYDLSDSSQKIAASLEKLGALK